MINNSLKKTVISLIFLIITFNGYIMSSHADHALIQSKPPLSRNDFEGIVPIRYIQNFTEKWETFDAGGVSNGLIEVELKLNSIIIRNEIYFTDIDGNFSFTLDYNDLIPSDYILEINFTKTRYSPWFFEIPVTVISEIEYGARFYFQNTFYSDYVNTFTGSFDANYPNPRGTIFFTLKIGILHQNLSISYSTLELETYDALGNFYVTHFYPKSANSIDSVELMILKDKFGKYNGSSIFAKVDQIPEFHKIKPFDIDDSGVAGLWIEMGNIKITKSIICF